MEYFWLFVSGALAVNGLPHFVSGLLGKQFFIPWARWGTLGSAISNAAWGAANFLGALLIWNFVFAWSDEFFKQVFVIFVGGTVFAVYLSWMMAMLWRKHPKGLAKEKK